MTVYLPVYCERCARASLASTGSGTREHTCSFCENVARVVPGPLFTDDDWLAFADLDAGVFEAELDGAQAKLLAEELQHLRESDVPRLEIVARMIEKAPTLGRVRPALVNNLERGLRMLITLLIARGRDVAPKLEQLEHHE